jgi:threonylcarbamoyladenosine tRNA methylthiotransferase MtaB
MRRMLSVCLETLGCKLNQAESEQISRELADVGFQLVSPDDNYDIYLLNSCAVTSTAEAKSRHMLRLAHRKTPEAAIVVTGCYTETAQNVFYKLPGVVFVTPNREKYRLANTLLEIASKKTLGKDSNNKAKLGRVRSFVKIQEGCSRFCSYCIVPFVRGAEKSMPPDCVVEEVRKRSENGCNEVILTGTEVGAYSFDGLNLQGLVKRILNETKVPRIRLSSLQPQEVDEGLLNLWQDQRLAPHFHLSLQSGSDRILRLMRRQYGSEIFLKTVEKIRSFLPGAALTTDVIVGFPGEDETEFEQSYDFCQTVGFARTHVFVFSPRPGTRAEQLEDKIPHNIKNKNARRMRELGKRGKLEYQFRFSGKIVPVLWEKQDSSMWSGYSDNYLRVYTRSNEDLENMITYTKILSFHKDGMLGELQK